MSIDSRHVGTIDGFDIDAKIVPDEETSIDDYDLGPEDISAWKRDEWSFVGTIVTASKAGIELGSASLWGSQYGLFPGIAEWVSPLNGEGEEFVNGYGPSLIDEAIEMARQKLAELRA